MTEIAETMKKFVEGVVKKIVDRPDEVKVVVVNTTKSILLQIEVAKNNIGQVVGKKGRTIDAIKLLSTAVKNTQFIGDTKDVFIEIIEDEKSTFFRRQKNLDL